MPEPIVVLAVAHAESHGQEVKLSPRQRALVDYIEHNPKFVAFTTAGELAGRVGVHPATVVRLAQLLGYKGYPDFQQAVRHRYLASLDAVAIMNTHAEEHRGDVALASIEQDIRNLAATRSSLDPAVIRLLAERILSARSVLIVGVGSHAGLAIIFSHLCQFMGLPVEAEVRGGVSLATRLARLQQGDVVIGTASWWITEETRRALTLARERLATTVVIVDNPVSDLAKVADHVLIGRTESVSFFQSMAGPLAALNALVVEIAAVGEADLGDRMVTSTRMYEALGVTRQGGNNMPATPPGRARATPPRDEDVAPAGPGR